MTTERALRMIKNGGTLVDVEGRIAIERSVVVDGQTTRAQHPLQVPQIRALARRGYVPSRRPRTYEVYGAVSR